MEVADWVFFALGLGALIAGAELLVRGASWIAAALGISPLVVGLTVVAYGTSSPEFAVSVLSSLAGQGDMALGNVVGSNIFNVLFILGASAVIAPLAVSQQLVRFDVPVLIGVSIFPVLFGLGGTITRMEGAFLLFGALVYTAALIRLGRRRREEESVPSSDSPGAEDRRVPAWGWNLALVVVGLALLVLGSRWMVQAAVSFAQALGVSELVIGLTVVAAGTSLPEVATSVVATLRREPDLAVGNVVGSNIFNILAVLGATALVAPSGTPVSPGVLRFDLPVMIAVAVACLPVFASGHRIARWEGFLFLGYYAAYAGLVVLEAARHDALPFVRLALLWFVLPLTAVTLGVVGFRSLWGKNE